MRGGCRGSRGSKSAAAGGATIELHGGRARDEQTPVTDAPPLSVVFSAVIWWMDPSTEPLSVGACRKRSVPVCARTDSTHETTANTAMTPLTPKPKTNGLVIEQSTRSPKQGTGDFVG